MSELRKPINLVGVGERAGSATAVQLPSVAGSMILIKALASNAGNVYLGGAGVTKANGTTDTTTGIELTPGDMTPWLPLSNLDNLYIICDNAGDDITYMVLG